MNLEALSRDFLRVCEEAAIDAARTMGQGKRKHSDHVAVEAMRRAMDRLPMRGVVVIGEGERDEAPMLFIGEKVGRGGPTDPEVDIAVDPLEGTNLCATGSPGAIAVLAVANKGGLLHAPDCYMDKIIVGPAARNAVDSDKKLLPMKLKLQWIPGSILWSLSGDTYPGRTLYYDGEVYTQMALDYMPNYRPIKLWTSDGSLSGPRDVVKAINNGCGSIFFSGHGNPKNWGTHPPDNETEWIQGLQLRNIPFLLNKKKQPVCIDGSGCFNAKFDTSLMNLIEGILEDGLKYFKFKKPYGEFWFYEWIPQCWEDLQAVYDRIRIALVFRGTWTDSLRSLSFVELCAV